MFSFSRTAAAWIPCHVDASLISIRFRPIPLAHKDQSVFLRVRCSHACQMKACVDFGGDTPGDNLEYLLSYQHGEFIGCII